MPRLRLLKGERGMAATRKTARKLIMALNRRGADIRLTENTFNSRKYERFITKYRVKSGGAQILSTYSLVEVITKLEDMLREGGDGH